MVTSKRYGKSLLRTLQGQVRNGLKKLRIIIGPYYVYLEELSDERSPEFQIGLDRFSIVHLTAEDMKTVSHLPGRRVTLQQLLKRLEDGNICLGMKHLNELAAFTWYDLTEGNIKGRIMRLKENEAYLFDAYTLPSYRGKRIAPFMRYRVYGELAEQGRTKFYSFTDCFNTPAVRFKQKLNAKRLQLRVIIGFWRWRFDIPLRKYNQYA